MVRYIIIINEEDFKTTAFNVANGLICSLEYRGVIDDTLSDSLTTILGTYTGLLLNKLMEDNNE